MHARKTLTKTEILDQAMQILAEQGEDALRIESLCSALGVTKGSFYHHFKSREDFSRQLLDHWVEEHTNRFIKLGDQVGDARQRYLAMIEMAGQVDTWLESAVRAWALRSPLAREYQERVDAIRLDYLRELYEEMTGDPAEAEWLAVLEYAAFIGVRQIMPSLPEKLFKSLPGHWIHIIEAYLSKSPNP